MEQGEVVTSWRELMRSRAMVGPSSFPFGQRERRWGYSVMFVGVAAGLRRDVGLRRAKMEGRLPRVLVSVAKDAGGLRGQPILNQMEARSKPLDDFYGIPNPAPGDTLKLDDLRERLIRQEETIIFALVERSQFRTNDVIYTPGKIPIPGFEGSFSEYLLYELEKVYAKVRRYTSPDEHSFCPKEQLPEPVLAPLEYPPTLISNDININGRVKDVYLQHIIPAICRPGDDQNYGSSATCDVSCLQALSKRIHYGKFIAESKYQSDREKYRLLAERGDRETIRKALTNEAVEDLLLRRVENKAAAYGQDIDFQGGTDTYKLEPAHIAAIYRDHIIPLTKEVEVAYLLTRPFVAKGG
mmetsp:Transcript_18531/g.38861  ORF Transcript_18531/g.38861 Transcript_18531/m.38861 type:complete len:355 (+) Transcript_18531:3-1067(+)